MKRQNGFTLIELLIVLVIVGLLAALVGPNLYQRLSPAKETAARAQLQSLATAVEGFYVDVGRYPSSSEGLAALAQRPAAAANWRGPYLQRDVPKDPWGNPYVYRNPGRQGPYEILSLGADGKDGGSDENRDLYHWQTE